MLYYPRTGFYMLHIFVYFGLAVCESNDSITQATSTGIAVQLAFVAEPQDGASNRILNPVTVRIEDEEGNLVADAASRVVLAIASGPSAAILSGSTTATAVNGVATFGDLKIDTAGAYTLSASSEELSMAVSLSFLINSHDPIVPPFHGTAFISPDIITSSDPTTFVRLTPMGQGNRVMFDRRVHNWITVNAHLFDAEFDDDLRAEIQVNPEFNSEAAREMAEKYGESIGRLPTVLRKDMYTVWIHMGNEPFGGGNNNILIHVGKAQEYEAEGVLEEILMHEAVHTSLDAIHRSAAGWLAAQALDPTFISTYARDFPRREDLAESFGPWFAVRYRRDRIPDSLVHQIESAIPNRLEYLDAQDFNLYPLVLRSCMRNFCIMEPRAAVPHN